MDRYMKNMNVMLQKVQFNLLVLMSSYDEMQFMSYCINNYHLKTTIFVYFYQTDSVSPVETSLWFDSIVGICNVTKDTDTKITHHFWQQAKIACVCVYPPRWWAEPATPLAAQWPARSHWWQVGSACCSGRGSRDAPPSAPLCLLPGLL